MITIVAIDPGKSGGFAWQRIDGEVQLRAMPDTLGDVAGIIGEIIKEAGGAHWVHVRLEQVGGFVRGMEGRQPGSAMFSFGMGYGYIQGLCAGLGVRLELVTPQRWQKGLSLPTGGKQDERKRRLKEEAQRRYPGVKGITLKTCDALLIWEYANGQQAREPLEATP